MVATTEEYNNSYSCVCFSKALMVVGLQCRVGCGVTSYTSHATCN